MYSVHTVFFPFLSFVLSHSYAFAQDLLTLCTTKDIMKESLNVGMVSTYSPAHANTFTHDNNINVDIQYLAAKLLLSEKQTLPVIIHPAQL